MKTIRQIAAAGVLALLCGSATAQPARETAVSVNIPAQSMSDALNALAAQTGLQLLFHVESVMPAELHAPQVVGKLTPSAALAKLLAGTELSYVFLNERTVEIRVAKSEQAGGSKSPSGAMSEQGAASGVQLAQAVAPERTAEEPQSASGAARNSENPRIEEIVVTAQKRVERLQDVPVPVTAIRSETLISTGQLRLADYYTRIPGLNLAATQAYGGTSSLAIRGLSAGAQNNTATSVGIVVDDVQYTGAGQGLSFLIPEVDPTDIARIEVLRGPQGTLYGANSLGGLLKYVTADPSMTGVAGLVRGGIVGVNDASSAGYSFNGWVNVPLGDTLAVRASGFTRQDAGYIDDPAHGRSDVNAARISGGRLAALWRPSQAFSLKVSALLQDAKEDGRTQVGLGTGFGDLEQNDVPGSGVYKKKIQVYAANLSAQLGKIDLTAISAYSDVGATYYSDLNPGGAATGTGAALDRLYGVTGGLLVQSILSTKFSQEVRLKVPVGNRLDWLVGAYYASDRKNVPAHGTARDYATGNEVGWYADFPVKSTFEEYSAFTNLTFRVTDTFDIQVGGRQGSYRTSYASGSGGPALGSSNPVVLGPTLRAEDDAFTYLLTPRWKPTDDLMVYARAASGYRSGGANSTIAPAIPQKYGPDKTQNYEVGMKGRGLNGAFSFDASVYYINWNDIQITVREPVSTFSFVANAGEAKSQGVELSVELRPLRGMTIAAWGAYNDAKLTADFPAATVGGYALAGERLPLGSRWSGNISVDQEFPLAALTGFFGVSYSYVGDRLGNFRTAATAPRSVLPSYTKLDLRAGARYGDWEIDLFANNVTDERGILGELVLNPNYFTVIQPRAVGLSVSRSF